MELSSFLLLDGESTRKFLETTKEPKKTPTPKTSDRKRVQTDKYIPSTKEGESCQPPLKKRNPPPSRGKSIDISGVKKNKPSSDIDRYCKRLKENKGDVSALAGLIQACLKVQGFSTKIMDTKPLARVFSLDSDPSSNDGMHHIPIVSIFLV